MQPGSVGQKLYGSGLGAKRMSVAFRAFRQLAIFIILQPTMHVARSYSDSERVPCAFADNTRPAAAPLPV